MCDSVIVHRIAYFQLVVVLFLDQMVGRVILERAQPSLSEEGQTFVTA
jgi:hypothetical protein